MHKARDASPLLNGKPSSERKYLYRTALFQDLIEAQLKCGNWRHPREKAYYRAKLTEIVHRLGYKSCFFNINVSDLRDFPARIARHWQDLQGPVGKPAKIIRITTRILV